MRNSNWRLTVSKAFFRPTNAMLTWPGFSLPFSRICWNTNSISDVIQLALNQLWLPGIFFSALMVFNRLTRIFDNFHQRNPSVIRLCSSCTLFFLPLFYKWSQWLHEAMHLLLHPASCTVQGGRACIQPNRHHHTWTPPLGFSPVR